jgi:predicted permease
MDTHTVTAEVVYALRMLRKSPLTTLAAILTLALGLGGTTAIFSVVDAVLLRPLPYAGADHLVRIWATSSLQQRGNLSPGDFVDFRRDSRSFEGIAATMSSSMSLTGGGAPEQVRVQSVSGNFLSLLGVRAVAGRTFTAQDDEEGSPDRVVLSERLWKSRYGSAGDLGHLPVTLGGRAMEVLGVVPSEFRFGQQADLWLLGYRGVPRSGSVTGDLTTNRDIHVLEVIGKLAHGVSERAALAELDAHAARLAREYPKTNAGYGVALQQLRDAVVGDSRRVLFVLLGAVAALLAIAAVNVANLMLVRTSHRTVELTMRSALGASPRRLIELILIEAVVLAGIGGLLGAGVATIGVQTLVSLAPPNLPRLDEVTMDGRVLAAGLFLTLATGCAFGLWPAWRASRATVAASLSGAGRASAGRERRRAQYFLVGGELALAQVLLVAAGLLVASFGRLLSVDPGVATRDRLTVDVSLAPEKYRANPARKAAFHEDVLRRVSALPGIDGVAMALTRPLSGAINRGVRIEGRPELKPGERQTMSFVLVSEGYFGLLEMPLRRGRDLSARDTATTEPVVVVNDAFVRRYLGNADPLTQRIGFGDPAKPGYWRTIVGVVADAKERLAEPGAPTAYMPFRQDGEPWNFASYVIKTALPTPSIAKSVQQTVLGVDPDQPISRARTLDESLSGAVAVERFTTLIASVFAALALVLAGVGAFGVMSHVVASRRRELGVRLAVGARPRDIVTLVALESLRIIAVASVAGLGGAIVAGRWMTTLLFEVKPGDPKTMVAAVTVLVVTAFVATYLPVRRALAANPIASLRDS